MPAPVLVGRESIRLGSEVVEYELRRSGRRTLGITIRPNAAVTVTAPNKASMERIESVLRLRGDWILRHQRKLAALPPAPRPQTHRYLGRQYRLKVEAGAERGVRLVGGYFHVSVPDRDDRRAVQGLMERWYLQRAWTTFERRMDDLIARTPALGLQDRPPIIVRRMKTRWGSCSPQGRIALNVEAVKLPVTCIDYLLIHELCHLRVPHHGATFWRLLERCMPDWERWRKRMDQVEL